MGSFPQNGYRPSGFGATNAGPMQSLNSPYNTSSATPTYSSLKSTLMRGASGLFGQRPPPPQPNAGYGGIGGAPTSPFGAGMGANSRFPTSPFSSPQKTASPVSPFGSPQKSPFGAGYGVSSLSPSSPGLRGGVGAGALVPSISSLTSPSSAQRPFASNFASGAMGRGGMGSPFGGGGGGSPSAARGMGRWPAMTSSQQLQQLSRPNGARPAIQRPALRGRGGVRAPGSTAAGASPRFTRVPASQFLNSSTSAASSSAAGGAARMASPGKSPAKAGASDSSTALTHKCRFPACQGKSFLTEQVSL